MFGMLLWKEWKENLWKLRFCGAASAIFTIILFRIRIIPDFSNCILISFIQMFAVPVIFSLDIFSGEISNRTVHLLFKIPVPRWMLFLSKYLVSLTGIIFIFLISGFLMEFMSHGRETQKLFLLTTNSLCGVTALTLFTWFCAFGCQGRSEADSLVTMFGVFIGWGIVFFWARVCEVVWAVRFVPYSMLMLNTEKGPALMIFSQILLFTIALTIACYRYVSIRRYL
jgi:ABC-type transport system involved in multi-copper enzyme maturation permease subunit